MREKLVEAFERLLNGMIEGAPKAILGIVLVLAGLIVAKVIEAALRMILRRARFDDLVRKIGVDQVLHRLGIRDELSHLLPRLVYFLVLILLAQTISDALGLLAVSKAITAFFQYLPNIVAALLLLIVGSLVGQFAGQTVAHSAESSGLDIAPALGRMVSGGIFFVCAMMAVSQLQIDTTIVRIVTSIILGGAALAFGLSFGFGTREIVRNIAAGFYARKVLAVGLPLEIAGHRGVLKAVTATHLILESESGDISISNAAMLRGATRQ